MRIRTIKPEFFVHEGLFDAEQESGLPLRIAFAGLWCAADREGRFKWEARRLGVQILPYDQVDFSRVLDALSTRGFILKYTSGTGVFGVIPSFKDHQVINNREKDSELPEPPEYMDSDACPTRASRVPHAGKAEGKGKEGNMEGKGKEEESAPPPPAPPVDLLESEELSSRGQYLDALSRRIALPSEQILAAVESIKPPEGCFDAYLRNRAAEDWRTPRNKPVGMVNWFADFERFAASWNAKTAAAAPPPKSPPKWLPENWRQIASGIVGPAAAQFEDWTEIPKDRRFDFERACRGHIVIEPAPVEEPA